MGEVRPITQAVILAGGRGERLRPLTDQLPKPLVPINGRPFLEHLIELLKDNGISEVVLLVGYLSDKIIDHFGDGEKFGLSIRYSVGSEEDMTGTRVRNALPLIAEEFLLLYCDNYWPLDLGKLTRFYRAQNTVGLLTAYSNLAGDAEHGRANNIRVEKDGRVTYYGPFSEDPALNAVDIGFFLMNKGIAELMPAENFSFEHAVLPRLIKEGQLSAYVTDHPYCAITTIAQLPAMAEFLSPRKVIFLDRDGVINRSMPPHQYVTRWEEFEFLPGALQAIMQLSKSGCQIYIVTNQRGISLGLMSEGDLNSIHRQMVSEIEKNGGAIAGIYYCPHGDEDDCRCRKPKAGMFFQAAREHRLNLAKATFVGDTESDRQAGEATGCRTIILQPGESLLSIIDQL